MRFFAAENGDFLRVTGFARRALTNLTRRPRKLAPEERGEVVAVAKTALIGDIRDALFAVAQQIARFHQAQAVKVALRRQPGALLKLAVQRAQRQPVMVGELLPANLFRVMFLKPGDKLVQPFIRAAVTLRVRAASQQNQQLHKEHLHAGDGVDVAAFSQRFQLPDQRAGLMQRLLADAPVRRIVTVLLLRQELFKPRQETERLRRAIQHIGQAEIFGVLVEMAIVVAHKANGAAAERIRLTIKHMRAGAVFNNDNLIKIMMMLRKSRLRQTRFNGHRRRAGWEKINAL